MGTIRANIYLFNVNNRNTRKRCETCSKLTIKKIKNDVSYIVLVFLLLTWTYFASFCSVSIVHFAGMTVNRLSRLIYTTHCSSARSHLQLITVPSKFTKFVNTSVFEKFANINNQKNSPSRSNSHPPGFKILTSSASNSSEWFRGFNSPEKAMSKVEFEWPAKTKIVVF